MENISTRRIAEHDEDDPEERKQTEKVRCFIDNIRWRSEECERGGITWIELYALYALHGGCSEIEALKKKHPLMKTASLQSAVAAFKKRVRPVAKVSADEKDEWKLATCIHVSNRLQPLAISSRQAAIQGMPALTDEDSIYIAQALLAMRGINQEIHKAMHADGNLKLLPKPFAYKGTSHSWMRNLKRPESTADWTREPAMPDGPYPVRKPLKTISCPECKSIQSRTTHRLQVKVGVCQLACQ